MNDFVPAPKVPFLVERAEPSVIDGEVDHISERFFMYKGSIDDVKSAFDAESTK